jgi:osmotically-inducible protein OsmY
MIDVAVDDGVATLSGVVGSAAERSKARNLAWVAGVTDVEADELEVRRWARDEDLRTDKYVDVSDAAAHTALKDALLYDPRTTSYEITAQIDDGVATLRGSVDSLLAKRAAAQVARNTVGIRHVNNRIKVNPLPTREDGEIAEDVTAALERNPYVGRHEVTVAVTEGVAHLYGTVDSFYEKAQADDAAGAVAGVLEVDNNLDVADVTDSYIYDPYVDDWYIYGYDWYDYEYPAAMETDAEILDDIEDQLFWSPFVDSDDVNVSVEDGVATLTGEVDSWSEFEAARENAFEGGATWVKNYVTVE